MPAFSTHYIFATEMMAELRQKADFKLNENAVLIGTQGPDIFFFHRVFPWQVGKSLRKVGSLLHRAKAGDMVDSFYNYCSSLTNSLDSSVARSYVYGFILHYALDRNCHPYIFTLQDEITKLHKDENPHNVHNTIEFAFDSLLIKEKLKIENPLDFNTTNTLNFSVYEKQQIARALASCQNTISAKMTSNDIEVAIDDLKYAQQMINCVTPSQFKTICFLEKIASPITKNFKVSAMFRTTDLENAKKYVNISNDKWISPYESKIRNESFFDLYELSKNDALNMIDGFNNGLSGEEITHNLSFLTGVEVK